MAAEAQPERLSATGAEPFSARLSRWLVGVAAVSLLLTLLLGVMSTSDAPSVPTPDANAFSVSAVGHRAFAEVLDRLGIEVTISRHRSGERASGQRALLLLEPAVGDKELERLTTMLGQAKRRAIPTLLTLPKWRVSESVRGATWVNRLERATAARLHEVMLAVDAALDTSLAGVVEVYDGDGTGTTQLRDRTLALALDPPQYVTTTTDLEPVAADESGRVLVARIVGTKVFVLSDPDVLSTMGLSAADHAVLGVDLITDVMGVDAVVIDETAHGFEKARTVWQELFTFPLVLVTFHLALLLGLALWTATWRFGPPDRLPPRVPPGKRTLIENTATLLALGHHAATGTRRYLEAALRHLSRAYGLPAELPAEQRLQHLARLARRVDERHDLEAIARDVAALEDGRSRRRERRALALASRIHRLKSEMLHGNRSGS